MSNPNEYTGPLPNGQTEVLPDVKALLDAVENGTYEANQASLWAASKAAQQAVGLIGPDDPE